MTFAKSAAIAAMFVLAACATAPQADEDWELLGEKVVSHQLDRDEIVVGKREGDFERIALRVRGAAVEFHRVTIHFNNGDDEVVEMREEIEAGGETRAIDLPGDDRHIRSVSFNYHTEERGERALVQLFGMS